MQHFMIGLGGTGGRILRELRKIVREEFPGGKGDPVGGNGQPVAGIGYLYVDSDNDALHDRESWRMLGESVQLKVNQRLLISDGNLGDLVRNIDLYPNIKPWIGDPAKLEPVFRATAGSPGAGQIRRFGRALFAVFASKFAEHVTAEVAKLQNAGRAQVSFHLCGTLAGGTGSGSIVDAAVIIRNLYPDAKNYPIFLYVLATAAPVGQDAKANFWANQYAALKELGGFILNDVHPHVLTGHGERSEKLRDCAQACYILTDRNQNDCDLTLDDQQQLVAEYLFHRAITLQDRDAHIRKSWTYEDSGPFTAFRGRCAKFNSLGVKRWAVPTVEMREKVAFSLGASAIAQILYNNWVDDYGYQNDSRPMSLPNEVAKSDEATAWRLAEPQLLLDHGFELSNAQEPVPAWDIEWKRVVGAAVTEARSAMKQEPAQWLREVQRRADEHLANGFRQKGVAQWYLDRHKAAKDYSLAIRQTVEADLFARWRTGVLGLHDIRRIVEALREEVARRLRLIDSEIIAMEADIRNGEHFVNKTHSEWVGLGLWAKILRCFGSDLRAQFLSAFEQRLLKLCMVRTRRAATDFKTVLLQETLKQLDDWQHEVGLATNSLESSLHGLQKSAADRCPQGTQRQFEKRHVREYEPEMVNVLTKDLKISHSAQQTFSARLRGEIEQSIAPYAGFRRLQAWLCEGGMPAMIDRCAYESAEAQIDILARQGGYPNILKAGIIDTLRIRYATDDGALQRDVELFVQWAAAAYKAEPAPFQPNQDPKLAHWPGLPMKSSVVFLPINVNSNDPFERRLRELFSGAATGVHFVYTDRIHEITVLTTDYLLPAHFFRTVSGLKEKYVTRRKDDSESADRELHIEDWSKGQLTDLLIAPEEVREWIAASRTPVNTPGHEH